MERIVNGHYADNNSTRSILDITPQQFEVLITILQEKYKAIEMLWGLDEETQNSFFEQNAKLMIDSGNAKKDSNFKEVFNTLKQNFAEQYEICYQFLSVINQPYPGADYSHL